MSLYLHIPFCRQACSYCDFHFSVNRERIDALVDALVSEIELQQSYLPSGSGKPVLETIYFGGGTPSLLERNHFTRLFNAIGSRFAVAPGAEITLEANPDDLTPEKLNLLRDTPVNRLSIGVQSFSESDLKWMHRAHTATEAVESVQRAAAMGFDNITIDLMYGLPELTPERWEKHIRQAFSLPVQHLSCYCLTVEPKTVLARQVREGQVAVASDDAAAAQFELLMDLAASNGFSHYEISNFARPGFESRHNSRYWQNKPYLGIGPSAHSFNGTTRQWNVASNAAYMLAIRNNEIPATEETLTPENRYNEYIMTGLRTREGVQVRYLAEHFDPRFSTHFLQNVTPFLNNGAVTLEHESYLLTRRGKLMADRIASELFFV